MVYKDIVLLFNGNLYNKDTLKSELLSLGYEFKGISDTEELPYLYIIGEIKPLKNLMVSLQSYTLIKRKPNLS